MALFESLLAILSGVGGLASLTDKIIGLIDNPEKRAELRRELRDNLKEQKKEVMKYAQSPEDFEKLDTAINSLLDLIHSG